jgi:hypothetical protein
MTFVDEVLELIRAPIPQVTVFDSGSPDENTEPDQVPERYAVYWPDLGTPQGDSVCGEFTGGLYRWQLNFVAPRRDMAEWMALKVRTAILGETPLIPGWLCGQIQLPLTLPARRDEQVLSRRVVVLMDRYELLAEQR